MGTVGKAMSRVGSNGCVSGNLTLGNNEIKVTANEADI